MIIEKISLGNFTVHGLRDGFFHLDGGAMFGVVPKVMWQKLMPPDEDNRIKLGLNSLLVETPEKLILIETGVGTNLKKEYYDFYSIDRKPGLTGAIKNLGYKPEDIDIVINTHLHFDHSGGNTIRKTKGGEEIVPTYPNAEYIIQQGEWDAAVNPTPRDRASYLKQNFIPLQKAGNVRLVIGNTRIAEGVEVVMAEGHTLHHQCVKISSGGKTIFFMGDMVPTSSHIGLPYIMSYDLYPIKTMQSKQRFYDLAFEGDWIIAFNHDPDHYFGKIGKVNNKYVFQALS
ncbi:MAG: MBL fold metallo-hydrolase [Candidatus Aminicenantes bacterium]|nr:MBL fold metallo-hydrolase [Candidatus Aminicenantes bacterium]